MDDIELSVKFSNHYSQHYLGINEVTLESVRSDWESPGFTLQDDTRMVFSESGELVGYVEVWTDSSPPVHPWVWFEVHPEHAGIGIGTAMLTWAEGRAREAISRVPDGVRVAIHSGTVNGIEPTTKTLQDYGLTIIRHAFRMIAEMDEAPPEPGFPPGIEVRTFNRQQDAEAVYRADTEAFRDHFGFYDEPFEEAFPRFVHFMIESDRYDPDMWFLAMDGDEIAGLCLGEKHAEEDPESGYIRSLAVRRPWRRRGIGLALLRLAFGEYYRRGFRKVMLGVDAENLTGALGLYEKAGMHVLRQFDIYELELREGKEIATQRLAE